jgi:hypothetical protein
MQVESSPLLLSVRISPLAQINETGAGRNRRALAPDDRMLSRNG